MCVFVFCKAKLRSVLREENPARTVALSDLGLEEGDVRGRVTHDPPATGLPL